MIAMKDMIILEKAKELKKLLESIVDITASIKIVQTSSFINFA